ncbi:MAG: transglycosylase domain-containing protein [Bdellovibrionota bacterium]
MKKIFLLVFVTLFIGFIPAACGAGYVAMQIFSGDYSQFEKSKILEILSKETVLLYSDGSSQLGSLFGEVHRIYVPIDRIPKVMREAIVSAEDEDFYTNIGIDIKGIIRAGIHNLLSRSRQGASTITQQTVKNLYGRKETDLVTKFNEMINAFKMERMYSKDQILEFYLNQFHVTGNGRGVGVASKYYFNKEVEDLTLIEAAFIAASVKGPEKYNPFTKTTLAGQDKAKRQALIRKNYVLERMLKNHKISKEEYDAAVKEPVPFNQGRFQYNEVSVNQIVQKQLARPEILQAIGANTVDEIGTMGLHITTTLDQNIQSAAQYGLRQNLSGMQMILKGFAQEPASNFVNIQKPELHSFYVARIDSISTEISKESMRINFGVNTCLVDTESINRVAIKTDQTTRRGLQKSKDIFLKSLSPGQTILASIKKIASDGQLFCDLETRPKVQGASLVLDKGKIIAMAGGFSSNEYNRALFAQRQPGSTFKLPTYYAALQMGWTVLDSLPNVRDAFPWQGNIYFPRSDHPPKTLETTILGAGAVSENLASVWLLAHMLDKLNYNQFQDLLKFLDIMKKDMTKQQVLGYIANKFNATPDNIANIAEGVLNKIKNDYMTDFNILNNNSLKIFIRTLHYGSGFDKQQDFVMADKEIAEKEKKIRLNSLKNNLLRWNVVAEKAQRALAVLAQVSQGTESITETNRELLSSFSSLASNPNILVFNSSSPWQPQLASPLVPAVAQSQVNFDSLLTLVRSNAETLNHANVLLDGVVPLNMIEAINQNLSSTLRDVRAKDSLERLFWNADFRYSLGIYYTAKMVNAMGVNGSLQWVPSFPLGSNVVTLADLSLMYQTFLSGKLYRYFNTPQSNQLLVIKRIEDSNGNLLWESKAKEVRFAESFYSTPILNTMHGTITAGTAYNQLNSTMLLRSDNEQLDKQLLANKIRVPVFGKTGTTNNFTNGTYIGFLPYPAYNGDTLSSDNAYTIASYVGYDSNDPMVNKWYHAVGGAAIPAWQEIALDIIKEQNFAEKLNWQKLAQNESHLVPFNYGSALSQVIVPIHSGVSLAAQALDADDSDSSDDIYANDYSETGKHTFTVYLDGSVSGDVFIPKRRISFYTPYNSAIVTPTPAATENNVPKKQEEPAASPLEDTEKKAQAAQGEAVETQEEVNAREGTDEDLPPPPPPLRP